MIDGVGFVWIPLSDEKLGLKAYWVPRESVQ